MSSVEKTPVPWAKIALVAAVVCCGAVYGIVEYSHRSDGSLPENSVPGRAPTSAEILAAEKAVTPEKKIKQEANAHYLAGVKYLQDARYELAREEFMKGKKLDPANADIKAGLERVNKILAP